MSDTGNTEQIEGYHVHERDISDEERDALVLLLNDYTPSKILLGALKPIPVIVIVAAILWFLSQLMSEISPAMISWFWVAIGALISAWLIFDVVKDRRSRRAAIVDAIRYGRVRIQEVKSVAAEVLASEKGSGRIFLFELPGETTFAVKTFVGAAEKLPALQFTLLDFLTEAGAPAHRRVETLSPQLEFEAAIRRDGAELPERGEALLEGTPSDYIAE